MAEAGARSDSPISLDVKFSSGQRFDIVIVGAGPAGLNAGLHAIRGNRRLSILLIDKTVPWEHPIQCAEAVGRLGFEGAIDIKESWIRQAVKKASFHAPDGTAVTYTDRNGGYIIDRAAMQRDCAAALTDKGVECSLHRRAVRISAPDGGHRAVEFDDGTAVYGRVVIDASGPVACLSKEKPLVWRPMDLEPAYFIHARGNGLPADTVHIYCNSVFAPGGYAWAFPRGNNEANIGILVGSRRNRKINITGLLDAFLELYYPGITIVNRFAGAIPCGFKSGPSAAPRLLKAGDAASTVNPISRAGICEALLSGGHAGDHALMMLEAKDEKGLRRAADDYESAWRKKLGSRHEKLARAKLSLARVPDADYDRAAHALARIPQESLTMSRIFRTALSRFPRLAWSLRHLM
jgi:digeranylgeranylglycerophospholipid reductase